MRYLALLLLLSAHPAFGQERIPIRRDTFVTERPARLYFIDSSDATEARYLRYRLDYREDTLPLHNSDGNRGWRLTQAVRYFFDSSALRCIRLQDGERDAVYFFFEEAGLRKARFDVGRSRGSYMYTSADDRGGVAIPVPDIRNGVRQVDRRSLLMLAHALRARFGVPVAPRRE